MWCHETPPAEKTNDHAVAGLLTGAPAFGIDMDHSRAERPAALPICSVRLRETRTGALVKPYRTTVSI
jgi:hypothetical protein